MPDWSKHVRAHLAGLAISPAQEAEIVEELSQHLDDRYRALLASGAEETEAASTTLAAFGEDGSLRDRLRALRLARPAVAATAAEGSGSGSGFGLELLHAARRLIRDWPFALTAVVILAVGIGSSAAVFAAVRTILFDPLPFPDAARLTNVWLTRAHRENWHFRVPPSDVDVMRQTAGHVFDRVVVYDTDRRVLRGHGDPQDLTVASVSADLFPLLGARAVLGRTLQAGDEAAGRGDVVLLSHAMWHRQFNGGPDVIGASVRIDAKPYRVVGVLPEGFTFPSDADAWTPRDRTDRQANGFVLARLAPDTSPLEAQAAMPSVVAAVTGGRPNPGMAFTVEPLLTTTTRHVQGSWWLLLGAVSCVLAIGCLNVSGLMLARGLRRMPELRLRLALGASRRTLIRLLASEAIPLATAGGVLAIVLGDAVIHVLRIWAPADTPRLADLALDPVLIGGAVLLSSVAAVVLALVPAIQLTRFVDDRALRAFGTEATSTRGQARARNIVVVAEIALALVLLAGGSLLARSLVRLTAVDIGFNPDHLLTMQLRLPASTYGTPVAREHFTSEVLAGLRTLPDVMTASAGTGSIMTGLGLVDAQRTLLQRISRDSGVPSAGPEEAHHRRVTPGFFQALGIPVTSGRDFTGRDHAGGLPVVIVNQAMARTYWGTEQVLGRRVSFEQRNGAPMWLEIVGVVGNTRDLALTTPPQPAFFTPLAQAPGGAADESLTFYMRTAHDPLARSLDVRQVVWAVDPDQPVADISTMESALNRYVAAPRFRTALLLGLAAVGLLLATVGIYALVSHGVTSRRPEMAVRLALGSTPGQLVALVLRRGLVLATAGIALGIGCALALGQFVEALLFQADSRDPLALVVAPVVVLLAVIPACYVPARRAARTDPASVMREGIR